jgi:hypothetical protein
MLKLPRKILLAAVLTLSFGLFSPISGAAEDEVCFNYWGSKGTGDNFGACIDTNSKMCVREFCFDLEQTN